jgi:hypothetical protein
MRPLCVLREYEKSLLRNGDERGIEKERPEERCKISEEKETRTSVVALNIDSRETCSRTVGCKIELVREHAFCVLS